jgi:prepilin-type processing-associated H-X9-DG protein
LCPSDAAPWVGGSATFSYGYNLCGHGWTPIGKLLRPAELFCLGDADQITLRPNDATRPGGVCNPIGPARHNDGFNFSYCDGHVKWMSYSRIGEWTQAQAQTYLPRANTESYLPGW